MTAPMPLQERIDSVYMLMWPGWETELRSNRWHFGKRWAARFPVVMVLPDRLRRGRAKAISDPRLANCTQLHVHPSHDPASWIADSRVQAEQISRHQREAGHRRALFWFYNPSLLAVYAMLPAAARVQHATEDYLAAPNLLEFYRRAHVAAFAISDLVIAASTGVAAGIRREAPEANVRVLSNGCDYEGYAGKPASTRFARERSDAVAIYAGNINGRLDFALLSTCVAAHPRIHFAFVGPVKDLPSEDDALWRRLLESPNVRWYGPADPDDLPGLYRAADVGLIPYKDVPMLTESGFPLKALEMIATELPVASTFMRPLEEIGDVLTIARDPRSFVEAVGTLRRGANPEIVPRMHAVARARSYDETFRQACEAIESAPSRGETRTEALAAAMPDAWREGLAQAARPMPVVLARHLVRRCLEVLPRSVRSSLGRLRR